MLRRLLIVLCSIAVALPAGAGAAPAGSAPRVAAAGPPMGWASWNSFAAAIDYGVIKSQVDAFVAAGLPQAGYRYVNIDEGWWQGTRDAAGNITVDPNDWPGGMSAIADYIHSKGLKAGIYTDAGRDGCGYYYPTGRPAAPGSGSEGHYVQDMTQFARWGFDYVKVDWCGGDAEKLDPASTYQAISDAVTSAAATTGRQLVLSICDWGNGNPWNWGPGTGALWRTSQDIVYWGQQASLSRVLANFDQGLHPTAQHTGYVNDPDMLVAGMSGLSDDQSRTHLGLWAISGAPLLAGVNLATMSAATAGILKNPDMIAVDQDPLGLQGVKVAEDSPGLQVYGKVLAGTGRRAVLLLNRTSSAATMTARWSDLGLGSGPASVRDLWSRRDLGSFPSSYQVSVPAGSSVLLTVTGVEGPADSYVPSGGTTFDVTAAATGLATATISYAGGGSVATLQVNGQTPTRASFPSAASGSVTVLVSLAKGANTVTLTGVSGLSSVTVRRIPGASGVEVRGEQSGRCLDADNNTITNGLQTQLWDCDGGVNQSWRHTADKQLVVYGNKCLDAYNNGTGNGTPVVIWDCDGQSNQQWNVNADGTITGVQSGLCLDASAAGTANGTKLILWGCHGDANQRWSRN